MSRTSTGCWKTQGLTETKVAKKCLAGTLLFLLGVLAQLTGEAGGLHQTSNGHHQVQRVMSMHNSTLPFIPSSTLSEGSAVQQAKGFLPMAATTSTQLPYASHSGWQQPSSAHRKTPSRTTVVQDISAVKQLVSVPIRHWWMAVYHHHGDQHSSRVKRLLTEDAGSNSTANFRQCLQEDLLNPMAELDILSVKGEPEWEDRVCATTTLDQRVHVLLEALPCPQHRVCQILSPQDLRELARPDQCRQVARNLWKTKFHKLYLMIRDFSDVLQQKFDIGEYSSVNEHHQHWCKEAYIFWICSTQLPMWLFNPATHKSERVGACQSNCLTVEKRCPFLIKGTEDDMASGNPSFMCKDAGVPVAVSSTDCCYTEMTEPLPGQGFPINVSTGFCHEPDHVQLHLKNISSGWSAAANEPVTALPSTMSTPEDLDSSSYCDKLLWPSASLNVTTSERPLKKKWSQDFNATIEDEPDLIMALARWLGLEDNQEAFSSSSKGAKGASLGSWTVFILLFKVLVMS